MFQSLLMFQVPGNTSQATPCSPPAIATPAKPLVPGRNKLRFGVEVLGNTIGCGAIFAACWFSVQLMQVLITP